MASVLDRAQNFAGGPVSAARQRDRWARQEANATDAETRESLREAIADLEARYPDLEDVPIGGAEAFAREQGHGTGARSPVHEGRRRPGNRGGSRAGKKTKAAGRDKAGAGKPKSIPGLTPGAQRSPAQRRQAQGKPTPRVDRAVRETGVPGALSSGGSTIMAGLGATAGLGLLYLVFSSAETPGTGAAALPSAISSVTGALGRFLSLQDVFPPSTPHTGVVPGSAPVRTHPSRAEVNRVIRGSGRFPGEAGRGGEGATLSNPGAELQPPRRHRPKRHRR